MITDQDILQAYHQSDANKTLAAQFLNIPRTTFRRRYNKILGKETKQRTKNSCVLIIPDMHMPYHHPDTIEFIKAVKEKYKPTRVICLGDEIDNHAVSFHNSDPNMPAAGDELEAAIYELSHIHDMFPKMDVIDSNHGSLFLRQGKAVGLPRQIFKAMPEILKTPGWTWHPELIITLPNKRNVMFKHGVSKNPVLASKHLGISFIQGHFHTQMLIQYYKVARGLMFAMNCGCLVDRESLGQLYAKDFKEIQLLGCGLIINSTPHIQPLYEDKHNRWTGSL